MKPIHEVYEQEEGDFFSVGDYQPLLNSFEYNILVQVDENDYQGDSWLLLHDGKRYGYLQFGWGSCSGCDALQGCSNLAEVAELRDSLHEAIQWFDSAKDALLFFVSHDWKGDYSWHSTESKQFFREAMARLTEEFISERSES